MQIYEQIERLINYGLQKKLITAWDTDLTRNKLLEVLELDEFEAAVIQEEHLNSPVEILETILDWSAENGRLTDTTVTYRDLLDTKIMACFVPSQTEIIRQFEHTSKMEGSVQATKDFYQYSQDVHYIRTDRIAKNKHWLSPTPYGDFEITINLSKPEIDPKAIEAAKYLKQSSYPKCLLCKENVGFRGRVNHPARQSHRIIPVTLSEEQWFLQFSPYVYYNEHAIVFSGEHKPMKISKQTFEKLLQFVEQYPHYFLGSNADLPIVGGSILSHDHFQGGHHDFPMALAELDKEFVIASYPEVSVGIVKWPMSVLRLQGTNQEDLANLANDILLAWKNYSDESVDVLAFTEDTPHNTITPIARRKGELYELDLVLRNNRTSDEHPLGIFHPHQEVHHIKKENIGLIEVMGLAVLPGRLIEELTELSKVLMKDNSETLIKNNTLIEKHLEWALSVKNQHPHLNETNSYEILQEEVGKVFAIILEHAGVFKRDEQGQEAFSRFIAHI
ncbi:UDP-glucose--hexose-1-phosphate uridylyltransferase [Metabacillus herbersteinensis]|uniref:Galactose-1-phosphate uridylyltransferase n=1 Tax=Metabacillus herbersteinensis TaxID=283816 RepID=A0ABV6GFD9_9BACI